MYVRRLCSILCLLCCLTIVWGHADAVKEDKKPSCFPIVGDWSLAFDYFRSLPEGSWEGNTGAFTSLDLRGILPYREWFVEVGGSYGLYDWAGRLSTHFKNNQTFQQQAFLTGAIARAGTTPSRLHYGLAYDWMFNQHFGMFAVNPMMSQVRGQFGYLFRGGNELGVWGTVDALTAHDSYLGLPLKFRAIPQVNAFWCHYFKNGAYGMLWGGTPYRKGLMYSSGRPGRYIFGARFDAPLTGSLSVTGHASYMGARSAHNGVEARNYAANVCFAINYAFGQCRKPPVPYMLVADNSTFIVDTNYNY